jgi:putative flippase GtrA/SAM-dependent methyltransferase
MVKAAVIDVREFARFVLSGLTATIGNVTAVWLTRRFLSFEIALLAGIATATIISFSLSKLFAFRSRSWNHAVGEAARFLTVYTTGSAIYWMIAVFIRTFLLARGVAIEVAEPGSILVGAGTMMLTSYCGHRFFTYRTYQRAKHLDDVLSAERPVNWKAERCAPDPCLICGGLANRPLYPATYAGSIGQAPTYFRAHRTAAAHGPIVRCRDCGFVFTSPRFSNLEYDRIYKEVRSLSDLDPSFERAKAARFQRLAAIVRKFQPYETSFLDFGCGDGGFLRQFNSPGGRGFEVGAEGRRMVGRYEIVTGDWRLVAGSPIFPPAAFDFIVAFDVLEHLPRIGEDLALIRTVLKTGGHFFVSVPNSESFVARIMGKRWNMLLLEHLWYFSPKTLERMMARYGFVLLAIRSVPYDASIAHLATRLAQTLGMKGTFKVGPISRLVLPIPAGIMLGVFRKSN